MSIRSIHTSYLGVKMQAQRTETSANIINIFEQLYLVIILYS